MATATETATVPSLTVADEPVVAQEEEVKRQDSAEPEQQHQVEQEKKNYVDTTLNYRLDVTKGGDEIIWGGTFAQVRRKYEKAPVRIYDARGHEEDFKLDTHGFQFIKHVASEKTFDDYPHIKEVYDPECEELMKKHTGATSVHVISHLIRKRAYDADETKRLAEERPDMEMTGDLLPARFVHVDQSYDGARRRLYDDLSPEVAEKLETHRWAIVNIWRPIQLATREPLGLCDARSVSDSELVDTMHLVPVRWPAKPTENHMWMVQAPSSPEQHKWHYLSNMSPEEAILLKIFDSSDQVEARRTPHSAFPTPSDYGPPRQSVETRCFLFWEHQETPHPKWELQRDIC